MERGNNMAEMIRESKNKKEVNSKSTSIIKQMEKEWPEMTK